MAVIYNHLRVAGTANLEYKGDLANILSDKSADTYFSLYLSKSKAKSGNINCSLPSNAFPSGNFLLKKIIFNLSWRITANITELTNPINISVDVVGNSYTLTNVASYSIIPDTYIQPNVWNTFDLTITDSSVLNTIAQDPSLSLLHFLIRISTDATSIATIDDQYFYLDGNTTNNYTAQIEWYQKSDIYRYSNKWQRLLQAYRYNGSSWEAVSGWPHDSSGDATKLLKPREHYYTYSITYDYNGGTDSGQSTSTHTYTSMDSSFEQTLANIEPARSGYQFLGWNTAADGSGVVYTKQQTLALNTDIKLYAVWIELITVTYQKTVEMNWAAASIPDYRYLTNHTGPASNISYIITYPDLYSTYSIVNNQSINLGDKFTSEWGRHMTEIKKSSLDWWNPLYGALALAGLESIGWCNTTVYGEAPTYSLSLPVGTKIKLSATSRMDAGNSDTRISLNGTVKAWGDCSSEAIYEHTFNTSGDIKFIWKTSGAFIPGISDTFGSISSALQALGMPGWSTSDDRDSFWDIQITN